MNCRSICNIIKDGKVRNFEPFYSLCKGEQVKCQLLENQMVVTIEACVFTSESPDKNFRLALCFDFTMSCFRSFQPKADPPLAEKFNEFNAPPAGAGCVCGVFTVQLRCRSASLHAR